MSQIQVTAVGDTVDGRTNLLNLQANVSKHEITMAATNQSYTVLLRDTGNMAELDRLQPAVYRDTKCFLLCYSENARVSFETIESKWCQEITRICPNVPFILVAYKSGNEGGDRAKLVTTAEGQKLMQKINASDFFEYSTEADVEQLLTQAVQFATTHRPKAEQIQSSAGPVDETGNSSGLCSCFGNCFKSKDSSYSFQ